MLFQQNALMQKIEAIIEATQQIFSGDVEDAEQALYDIEGALAEVFRLRRELVFMRPEDRVDEFAPKLAAQVAHLFLKHAELSREIDDPEAAQRSFDLAVQYFKNGLDEELVLTGQNSNDLMRRLLRDERTLALMTPDEIAEAWRDIFEGEARRQNYALAEDALFHAIELADDPTDHLLRGQRYFETLLKLEDEYLEEGGLTRDEVKMAIEEIGNR